MRNRKVQSGISESTHSHHSFILYPFLIILLHSVQFQLNLHLRGNSKVVGRYFRKSKGFQLRVSQLRVQCVRMFKLILGKLGELVLSNVGESFLSKVAEQTADGALSNSKNIRDFKLILKTLQRKLRSLSAKASDVEEEIKNAELSGRKKRKREVEEWLADVTSFKEEVDELGSQVGSQGFIMRLMDGGNAEKLEDEIDKLVEQSRNFGQLVLDVCGAGGETFLTNGVVGEAFRENLETILKLLEEKKVSSIGVYGMGGVGKTTLAKQVYNHLLLQESGVSVFWITVSQEFTITSLQNKIAHVLDVDLSDEDNEDKRASRLHRALSKMNNPVLILDDVWENIDMLKVGCSVSAECCRLIITSRSLEVCHRICCERVIRLEKLGEDEAWMLFNETLRNEIEPGSQLEEIAQYMAKVCDGLPLGIVTVAGSMRGEKAVHTWKNALAELKESVVGQDSMGDIKVFKVLKYSFDRLNTNHESESNEFNRFQLCFLYCSFFPEDEFIVREDLVEQGQSILDKLVKVCLLESRVNYINAECVKMHDLVRSMALRICKGKYLVKAGEKSLMEIPNEEEWTKDLEKVSLIQCTNLRCIEEEIPPDCPKLSTLLLCWTSLRFISASFFSKMQGLCTLDLCGNLHITALPDSISDMTSLKALLLENCHMLQKVPYVGKLKALRELNLSYTAIMEVPQGLDQLFNLKFLSVNASRLKMLPRGLLLKLVRLQYVRFPLHVQVEVEEMKKVKQVEEFGGGVKSVKDFNRFIETRVHVPCYRIGVNLKNATPLASGMYGHLGYDNNQLILCECDLTDETVLGQGVVQLTIKKCEGLSKFFFDDLSRLNNPTSLRKLVISRCGGIECLLTSEQGLHASQVSTLQRVHLILLDDLKEVMRREETGASTSAAPAQPIVFSFLKRLAIGNCSKMGKLGLPVSRVPNLEQIHIWECGEMEEIFEEDEGRGSFAVLSKLAWLRLEGLPRLLKMGLPVSRVPNLASIAVKKCEEIEEIFEDEGRGPDTLPKLRKLDLDELPRLKSISKVTMLCNSIREISIKSCPLMKKLPLHVDVPPQPTLEEIRVEREWWESLEWDIHPNLPQLLHPFLRFERRPNKDL